LQGSAATGAALLRELDELLARLGVPADERRAILMLAEARTEPESLAI
jgi:hypothetical protein